MELIWSDTTYLLINKYRACIKAADTQQSGSAPKLKPKGGADVAISKQQRGKSVTGPVEWRKLVARFRTFLSNEEKFYHGFLLRLVETFGLEAVQESALAVDPTQPDSSFSSHRDRKIPQPQQLQPRASLEIETVSHEAFPEAATVALAPTSKEYNQKLQACQRVLIFMGDLARYKELYNEENGRPRAGHEMHEVDVKKTPNGKYKARPRNFIRSVRCYHQARFLCPENGSYSCMRSLVDF